MSRAQTNGSRRRGFCSESESVGWACGSQTAVNRGSKNYFWLTRLAGKLQGQGGLFRANAARRKTTEACGDRVVETVAWFWGARPNKKNPDKSWSIQ